MKTATHKAKGAFKDFYYRKLQVQQRGVYFMRMFTAKWEFYDTYTNKWIKCFCPHSGMTEL